MQTRRMDTMKNHDVNERPQQRMRGTPLAAADKC
jgi:hypothetical protein